MTETQRRIVAACSVSIDGYSSGPGGTAEDDWLYEHAGREETSSHFEGVWRGCSTALVGRTNYEGFHSAWPGITEDPANDQRTRALGQWLAAVDKVVLSTTLTDAPWENSRIFRDLGSAVGTLRSEPGGDILVINSASVIQALLREDEVDDLQLMVVPVLLGGGLRLLPDGVDSAWSLASSTTMAHGAIALHYRRER